MPGNGRKLDLSSISRDEPLPAEWSVEEGLQAYLAENGFKRENYEAPRAHMSLMGLSFSIPNPSSRQWAVKLHDLHHVATGFGTDPAGEGQISAWECRRGVRPLGLYVGSIVVTGVLLGLLVAPLRTLRAWRASRRSDSLFSLQTHSYEELLALKIVDLRRLLDLEERGLNLGRRRLHSGAPKGLGSSEPS